jgi:undecaprenyl-phosphate galactose phosphotransferase
MTANTQDTSRELIKIFDQIKIKHNYSKRIFDILFASFAILFLSPIYLCITLLIITTSPGPVIYKHKRIGRGGKVFKCLKFRTMFIDADQRLKTLLENNEEAKRQWLKNRKLKNDPRIIKLGNFLRRTSLDELPQFFNVIIGDLSVVGPRPVMDDEIVQYFGIKASKILQIRPGITGIWQTSGRSNTRYETRIKLDEEYVDTHNLWLDIKIITKTIPCVLFSKDAF